MTASDVELETEWKSACQFVFPSPVRFGSPQKSKNARAPLEASSDDDCSNIANSTSEWTPRQVLHRIKDKSSKSALFGQHRSLLLADLGCLTGASGYGGEISCANLRGVRSVSPNSHLSCSRTLQHLPPASSTQARTLSEYLAIISHKTDQEHLRCIHPFILTPARLVMYEKDFHFSATEDGNATQPPMEDRTLRSRPKAHDSKGSKAVHCDGNDRQYLISWRPSIFFRLLIAWLMIFGILVTVRNFSPAGLSSWTYHFPECDPTDWRRPSSHRFRFLPNNPSCESQIAQLIGVEIVFWLNASSLLWNTDFGQRHVKWVFGITTAVTGLTMGLIQDPSPALLLAMPIILSVCSSIGFVVDVGR